MERKRIMRTILLIAAVAAGLVGCATRESANVYSKHEAGREQTIRMATVDSVRKVTIEGSQSGVGAAAGGVIGGIAGSGVGQNRGAAIAGVIGAVGGGVLGNMAEGKATSKDALEVTVRLDNGEMRAIVQEADLDLKPGDRVRLVSSGGVTRVTR
jgi:outer membrane lipoprotein SlyB